MVGGYPLTMRTDDSRASAVGTAARPLSGRTALVTGASRRRGIGYAIARELARLGAGVVIHHFAPHDADQPWGADDLPAVEAGVREALEPGAGFDSIGADLRDPPACGALVDRACALTGRLDILVCNHARSGGDGSILDMTPEALDAFWETDTRSTLLLTRRFAERFHGSEDRPGDREPIRPGARRIRVGRPRPDPARAGKVVWMTSGQQDGPMRGEVAYATSKAALAGVTATVAAELGDLGITLNTINPGPVDTGYLDPGSTDRDLAPLDDLVSRTPFGRWGAPADVARLVGWLASPAGSWITGQVLTSDGGFGLV
jgi:3-oxoacyl-[acyl-carrier protein] reductase